MPRETGTVILLIDNSARVKVVPSGACSSCEAKTLCMGGDRGERVIEARNEIGAGVGDTVVVTIKSSHAVIAMLALFGLPIVLGFAGTLAGIQFNNNAVSAALGVGGVAIGLGAAKVVDRCWVAKKRIMPYIAEVRRG